MEPGVGQSEVHETRAGDLDGGDMGRWARVEEVDQRLTEFAWILARLLRGGERDVRRPVAVVAVGRTLERDVVGKRVDAGFGEGGPQAVAEMFPDVHERLMLPADPRCQSDDRG